MRTFLQFRINMGFFDNIIAKCKKHEQQQQVKIVVYIYRWGKRCRCIATCEIELLNSFKQDEKTLFKDGSVVQQQSSAIIIVIYSYHTPSLESLKKICSKRLQIWEILEITITWISLFTFQTTSPYFIPLHRYFSRTNLFFFDIILHNCIFNFSRLSSRWFHVAK